MARLLEFGRRGRQPLDVTRAVALDGTHVWVTLDAPAAGSVVAVHADTGRRTTFTAPVTPGEQTVRLAVADLPEDGEAAYHLVFVGDGEERPLTRPHPVPVPTRAPYTPDGRWHFRVFVEDHGLALHRVAVTEHVPVSRLGVCDGAIEIRWRDEAAGELLLLEGERDVFRVAADLLGGERRARVPADFTEGPEEALLEVAVVTPEGTRPLGRADNDLARPDTAVLLPSVHAGRHSARLRWTRAGMLRLRRDVVG